MVAGQPIYSKSRHPRSRARKPGASPQHPAGWQPPGHRSRGRASLPSNPFTGSGAEDGSGWPWRAEGQLLPAGAVRRLLGSSGKP